MSLLLTAILILFFILDQNAADLDPVVAIDLGTTYTRVGIYRNGQLELIPNDQGNLQTPSCVAFTSNGDRLIGDEALVQLSTNPTRTIFNVKRFIGRHWSDDVVKQTLRMLPYEMHFRNARPHIKLATNSSHSISFTPEEISAMLLSRLKQQAEDYLQKNLTSAIITVPAAFNSAQRRATHDSATIAGFQFVQLISDTSATAIAYNIEKNATKHRVLVVDWGGGCLDVSLIQMNSVDGIFKVLATNGSSHVGGEDFNQRVIDYCISLHQKRTGNDVRGDKIAVERLRREVEYVKRMLSSRDHVEIEIKDFYRGDNFSEVLTRKKFNELNVDLFELVIKSIGAVLNDAKVKRGAVDDIILTGGSMRIPKVQQIIQNQFPHRTIKDMGLIMGESVVYGTGLHIGDSSDLSSHEMILLDVYPYSLGVKTGKTMMRIVKRNQVLPTEQSEVFRTPMNHRSNIIYSLYEGENQVVEQNRFLGKIVIPNEGLSVSQVELTFSINLNGIMNVKGKHLESTEVSEFMNDENLSNMEIRRLIEMGEEFREQDKKRRRRDNVRDELEGYLYLLKEHLRNKDLKDGLEKVVEEKIRWLEENGDEEAEVYAKEMEDMKSVAKFKL